jgi:type I restriction enzyme S subunit
VTAVLVARREWLRSEASRLDAHSYSIGGSTARERIENSFSRVTALGEIARLFNGPRFARVYVRDPKRGVTFLSSSDIMESDPFLAAPLLSLRRTAALDDLLVDRGWTLMSCSGTVGNSRYVGPELTGVSASQHVMRIVPQSDIRPGFLFAFMASRFARAIVEQRAYGSVVQHVEPQHVADVPVPLPDDEDQARIHKLVERAAVARAEATRLLEDAGDYFDQLAGAMQSAHDHARAVGVTRRTSLNGRLDAFHHVGWAAEAGRAGGERLGTLADVISTARVPRVYTDRGVPFLSGIDVFRVRVTPRVRIARWVADEFDARVQAGDLAIQGSGQRYGLLGRVASIGERLDGWAASHDLFRIRTADPDTRARIFAFLRSDSGHRVMLRHSYGTSIPHVNPAGIAAIRVPELPADLISAARQALELREQADRDEQRAIDEVEAWLA